MIIYDIIIMNHIHLNILKRLCICKLPENSPGQDYPVPRSRIRLPRVNFSAPLATSVQMPLPPQNFARLLCSIPFSLGFRRQSNEVYSLSDTSWERSYYSNSGLTWKRMLTVLFVKALQAPQGTCIETLHTCWCIFWWCSWHSSFRTQEEVDRAARPAQKLAPQGVVQGTWMSSKSKEMITQNHTSIDPKQVGNKTKKLRIL